PSGHLDDFPWDWFVHHSPDGERLRCHASELLLIDQGSGDLSDVRVQCLACGAKRSIAEARRKMGLPHCRGLRPWLGAYPDDESVPQRTCEEEQRVLVRTASNNSFAQVETALTIPRTSRLDDDVHAFFVRHYQDTLALVDEPTKVPLVRALSPVLAQAP